MKLNISFEICHLLCGRRWRGSWVGHVSRHGKTNNAIVQKQQHYLAARHHDDSHATRKWWVHAEDDIMEIAQRTTNNYDWLLIATVALVLCWRFKWTAMAHDCMRSHFIRRNLPHPPIPFLSRSPSFFSVDFRRSLLFFRLRNCTFYRKCFFFLEIHWNFFTNACLW